MAAASDQAVAAAFIKRQLLLTWVAGVVASVVLAGAAVALFFTAPVDPPSPDDLRRSYRAFVIAAVVGVVALAVLLAVLMRHALGVARFAFRKEVND